MQNSKYIHILRKRFNDVNTDVDKEVEDILKDNTNTNLDEKTNLEITKLIKEKTNKELENIKIKKIAFCFLITNEINHEELWYNFFKNIDHNKYNIYIHYKDTYNLKYFSKYVLNNCRITKWGKVSLVLASNILFREALKDNDNYKFILLSGSCIPIKSFDYIYDFLINDNNSYFNLYPFVDQDRLCVIKNFFDTKFISKAHQWVILNRFIINRILEYGDINIIKKFGTMKCPDEHVYIMLVKYFNIDKDICISNNLSYGATTFTKWKINNNIPEDHPENYLNISINDINNILNSKSLFARKFDRSCHVVEIDNNSIIQSSETLNNYITKYLKL
jgi:hypothetical protein